MDANELNMINEGSNPEDQIGLSPYEAEFNHSRQNHNSDVPIETKEETISKVSLPCFSEVSQFVSL